MSAERLQVQSLRKLLPAKGHGPQLNENKNNICACKGLLRDANGPLDVEELKI